jgi:hypothetical protein
MPRSPFAHSRQRPTNHVQRIMGNPYLFLPVFIVTTLNAKSMKTKIFPVVILLCIAMMTFSCNKVDNATPAPGPAPVPVFQGPQNSSFEDAGSTSDSAKFWHSDACAQKTIQPGS